MQIALTPDQINAAVAALKKNRGITVKLPSGQLSDQGVTITYIYDGVSTLHIDVAKKPLFIGEGYIESQIRSWFRTQG